MDKKLLDALNNLSVALEEIANSLKDKGKSTSATAGALTSTNLDKKIKSIDNGIKQLQKDNKKILRNQETLLSMSRRTQSPATATDNRSPIEGGMDSKQKERLKSGVGAILMIAVGVLAIGAAFKIIGKVNFLSVISLAIALPLVAMAFEKIAKMKDLEIGQIGKIILVTVGIATAIALSSKILGMVQPVGIFKLITSIFIAGMFAAVSYSIGTLMKALKKVDPKEVYKLPIVMVAVSLAIVASSFILQGVVPVGIFKLFTAVMIAAMFGVVSYGLGKLLEGLKKVKPQDLPSFEMLPIVMVAMSLAITLSSVILQAVQPVGIFKLFTAVFIAATFVVLSYSIEKIMKGVKGVSPTDVGVAALVLVAITGAIVGASFLMNIMPVVGADKIFSFVGVAIGLSLSVLAVGVTMYALSKMGEKNIIEGGLLMIAVAVAVAASSVILSFGDYSNYPDYKWGLGVALSLGAFGLGAFALGSVIMSSAGLGAAAIALGLVSILAIAGTVVATAAIVGKGDYKNYPPISWSASLALSLGAFGLGSLTLGTFILGTFGLGMAALEAGNVAILMIADTIREASFRLSGGKWTGGPTKDWAEGVALAIGSFAPVYDVLANSTGLFSSGPSVEDMKNAIMTISQGIVDAATFFNSDKNKGVFDVSRVPSKQWAEGVGGAIAAFTPALDFISKNNGIFKSGEKALVSGIQAVSNAIVISSNILANGKYDKSIPQEYMRSISDNVRTYVDLAKYLEDKSVSGIGMLGVVFGMRRLADGYERLAEGVSKLGNELNKIDTEKLLALKNLTGSIVLMSLMDSDQFEKMMDALEDKAKILVDVMNDVSGESNKRAPLSTVKTGATKTTNQKTLDDVYNIMTQVQINTASIARSSDKLSKYVDEIRGGDSINLGKRK